jgi:hypothetical protein
MRILLNSDHFTFLEFGNQKSKKYRFVFDIFSLGKEMAMPTPV